MRRQATTLLVSGILVVALPSLALRLPAPYVRAVPGPVTDTLGNSGGKPLITIAGHPTTPTKGKIYLVTVLEYGGPGRSISGLDVLRGWWSKSDSVVPTRLLYPPTETSSDAAQQDADDMAESQEEAKVAALRYLGYQLQPGVDVAAVISPAAKAALKTDDIIVGVDGTPVTNAQALIAITKAHKAGDTITLQVMRTSTALSIPIKLQPPAAGGTSPTIGIRVVDSYTKPFEIDIDLSNVGGPSAGMAFALGIIDKLSGGNLTGGRIIAGTGTIDAAGNVGAIGDVQQKMAGARHAGATVFLVPQSNCGDTVGAVPKGLQLVSVTTLAGAVNDIKQIVAGNANVPTCPK